MLTSPNRKPLLWITITIFSYLPSCTKTHDGPGTTPGSSNDTTSTPSKPVPSSTGRLYYYPTLDFGTTIQCQDPYTNQPVWNYNPNYLLGGFAGTPVVVNDTLFANYDVSYVFAINAGTGKMIWRSPQLATHANPTGPDPRDNGPAYSNGKLFTNTTNGITCLSSSTGQILWSNEDGSDYYTTPVVDKAKVFVGTYTYHYTGIPDTFAFKAIDVNTGTTVWKTLVPVQSWGNPLIGNGVLLDVDGTGNYVALDENSGAPIWTRP
jgi:outer membrane protein assembly factor BamB